MNQPSHPSSSSKHAAQSVEVDASGDPGKQADELLVHGLMQFLHADQPDSQQRRVERVMNELRAESPADGSAQPAPRVHERVLVRRFRVPMRALRSLTAVAAVMGVIAAVSLLAIPRQTSAAGTLRDSIAALRGPGDRRFEVRITTWEDSDSGDEPHAIVDTRQPSQMLIRAKRPPKHDGDEGMMVVGRDARSRWAIRPDGSIERDRPEQAWPRFAAMENQSLFAESVDQMLEQMSWIYTFSKGEDERSSSGVMLRRVEGVRKQHTGPGPSEITVWIDDATKIVERVELRWNERDRHRFEKAPPPPPGVDMRRGPDDFRPRHGPGMRRPGGPDGPPPEFRDRDGRPRPPMRGEPPHRRPRPDGPDRGPDHGVPPPDGAGPDGAPPPEGQPPSEPDAAPPEGDRPPPPRDHARGPDDRPHHRPGDGPHRPMHRPPGERGMGPDGRPGGPGGPGGFRPPPPRKIVIQRVEAPSFEDNWFSPERHASPASERDSWPAR